MKKKTENSIFYELSCLHEGVTGSALILNAHFPNGTNRQILVDFGIFQESQYMEYNNSLPFKAENIDYILLTHTHIDHCGRIPYLVKNGYSGHIYCTHDAKTLLAPAFFDCAKILNNESIILTKKKKKYVAPLYDNEDVKKTLRSTYGNIYNKRYELCENIFVTFLGNGHMLGASMILVQLEYPKCETVNLLFTGDYNENNIFKKVPDIPKWVKELKLIIIEESTYGDSTSDEIVYDYEKKLCSLIQDGKTVLSPVIACERTEQVLYKLKQMQDANVLSKNIPIFLSGNLALEYFKIFISKSDIDFIPENLTLVSQKGINIDSEIISEKKVNFIPGIPDDILLSTSPKIILTTSGMADKGKAPFYLSKLISKENVTILFTCYLPENTLGYAIKNSKKGKEFSFNVYGEKICTEIYADVMCSNEFSSHAKSDKLLELLDSFENIAGVFINHGNIDTKEIFAKKVSERFNYDFVNVLDRSIYYKLKGYSCLKVCSSKYPSINYFNEKSRKQRKERKLKSKKSKPKMVRFRRTLKFCCNYAFRR